MLKFLHSLAAVLPCKACRRHYAAHIARSPPPVSQGRQALLDWLLALQLSLASTTQVAGSSLDARQVAAFYAPMANGMSMKRTVLHISQAEDSHAPY